jgi:hypothetical protein
MHPSWTEITFQIVQLFKRMSNLCLCFKVNQTNFLQMTSHFNKEKKKKQLKAVTFESYAVHTGVGVGIW